MRTNSERDSPHPSGPLRDRIGLHSTLRRDAIDVYREHHESVPGELLRVFEEAGIRDWTIWRSGDRLFHLVECADFEAAMDRIASSDANDRWQADIGRFVDAFHGPDGEPAFSPMEHIWSLRSQRDGTP